MKQRIILTRPPLQAKSFIEATGLDAGHFFLEPLLQIAPAPFDKAALQRYDLIIATSANAFSALKGDQKSAPVLCTGPQTAEAAREAGFNDILCVVPDGQSLINHIRQNKDYANKTFLYLRGEHITTDITASLAQNGIDCRDLITYRAEAAKALSPALLAGLQEQKFTAITFFSARTADIFKNCFTQSGCDEAILKPIKSLCISAAVINYLPLSLKNNGLVASTPDRYGMRSLILKALK